MPTFSRSLFLVLAMTAGIAIGLSGCGRKGDLDVPGQPPMKQNDPKAKEKVPERPFFLDPIL